MGQSARLLADDPDKSAIAQSLLFKVGALGRCDLCGETAIVKTDYEELDNLVAIVQKAYPNALKANFHDDPVVMRDYIISEYADAAFQCEDCNENMGAD